MPVLKPESCKGCPFAEKSAYFTPDAMLPQSEVLILGQAPGKDEEEGALLEKRIWVGGVQRECYTAVKPQPLIGKTGYWLKEDFWPETGIEWEGVSRANVIKCRPYGKDELPSIKTKELRQAVEHCTKAHLKIPEKVKHVLTMGVVGWYALTGMQSLRDEKGLWRGYCVGVDLVKEVKLGVDEYYSCSLAGSAFYSRMVNVFCTLHIAALFRDKKLYRATRLDFKRFGNLVRGTWPETVPVIRINELPQSWPKLSGFDTEFDLFPDSSSRQNLIRWSMADAVGKCYVVDAEYSRKVPIEPKSTIVMQYLLADITRLANVVNVEEVEIEDLMLAHSVLHTGEPHSLDYICSTVGRFNRHKHLSQGEPYLYAGLDAFTTLNDGWAYCVRHFKEDLASRDYYKNFVRDLFYIIGKSEAVGVRVDKVKVALAIETLQERVRGYKEEAFRILGREINLNSTKQVGREVYELEG